VENGGPENGGPFLDPEGSQNATTVVVVVGDGVVVVTVFGKRLC